MEDRDWYFMKQKNNSHSLHFFLCKWIKKLLGTAKPDIVLPDTWLRKN